MTSRQNIRPVSCEMTGTYRGRSRHRLPRREGARIAGRTGVPRNPCKSVPGVSSCLPPGTEIPRKRVRCPFPASHLARKSRESVSGVLFRLPLGTEIPRKRVRCHFPPPTWHGILAKAYQVSCPAAYLPRNPRESVSGVLSRCPPGTEIPRKCSRWHLPSVHLARKHCPVLNKVYQAVGNTDDL